MKTLVIGILLILGFNKGAIAESKISLPNNICDFVNIKEINKRLGSNFKIDPENNKLNKALKVITGDIVNTRMCSMIAPPLRDVDNTSIVRNVAMIVVTFDIYKSKNIAKQMLEIDAKPIFNEPLNPVFRLGDEAVESSALFVRENNLLISVRFSPYAHALRDKNFIEIEYPVAKLILSKLR